MEKKIFLFDFDGTIADTFDAAVRIYNAIASENGYVLITKENLPTLRNMNAMDIVRHLGISILKIPFIAKQVRALLRAEVADIAPIEGVVAPLHALKELGHELHIVSSNSKENIQEFLDHNGINVFTDVHSVSNIFGKHLAINTLVAEHGWIRASIIYVGDEARDMEAAKKAGVKAVAVTWGYNSQEALEQAGPDLILKDPVELGTL